MRTLTAILILAFWVFSASAQEKPAAQGSPMCPMHEQQKPQASPQDQHQEGVVQRGDEVMGFSHEKTTHHFRLYGDGGAIEVEANDVKDTANRDQIRSHLGHIVTMFAG